MELSREREPERLARPPEPAPPEPERSGALDWASAMGNQAVARLARQAALHEDSEADEAESGEAPPEVQELEAQGIGMEEMAGLAAVDDLAEGDLPE
jgi:hypothetical protein